MAIIARQEKSNFTPTPKGLWPGVCCDVVDLGIVPGEWGPKHKIQIKWLVEAKPPRIDGKPYMVSKKYTLSLHEKANLRIMLETWGQKEMTPKQLEEFDVEGVVGTPCQIQVAEGIGDDGPFSFPQVVLKANGAKRIEIPKEYVRVKDRPDYKQPAVAATEEPEYVEDTKYQATDDDCPF